MKYLKTTSIALLACTAFTAAQAQQMVAGWDFSQYSGDGLNILSNPPALPFTETLTSNYSDLDPNGVGIESTAFGSLYYDGQFGSTNVDPDGSSDEILPTSGNLASNTSVGIAQFANASGQISLSEGAQNNNNNLSFLSKSAVSIVFEADTSTVNSFTDWSISFAGLDFNTGDIAPATIDVSFSTDGSTYGSATTFNLTGVDSAFSTSTFASSSTAAYFKFDFGGTDLRIDNVGISGTVVPEPSSFAAIAGALALAFVGARRRK